MHAHRLRSCEVPVEMRPRLTGTSAIGSTQSVYYMVKVLLAIFVSLFRTRPVRPTDAEIVEAAGGEQPGSSVDGVSNAGIESPPGVALEASSD